MTIKPATMKQNQLTVREMLEKSQGAFAEVLPKHLTPERLTRIALSEMNRNPELKNCTPVSFMSAVMQCSQMGLEPSSALGLVHLIPYNKKDKKTGQYIKEVQVIIGYQGLLELARRTGKIKTITAECVYEKDDFDITMGLNPNLTHSADVFSERGKFIGVYAVAKFKDEITDGETVDGGFQYAVMSKGDLKKIEGKAKYPNPIWKSDFDEMAKKTVIRRLTKMLPKSAELQNAVHQMKQVDEIGQVSHAEYLDTIGIAAEPESKTSGKELAQIETAKENIYKKVHFLTQKEINTDSVININDVDGLKTLDECLGILQALKALEPKI